MTDQHPVHTREAYKHLTFLGESLYKICIFAPFLGTVISLLATDFVLAAAFYAFYIYFKLLRFLHPFLRMIVSVTLAVFAVNFYDTFISINRAVFFNDSVSISPIVSVLTAASILYMLNENHEFLDFSKNSTVLLTYITSISMLFYVINIVEYSNVSISLQLLGKFVTLVLLSVFINRNRKYEAPHILDFGIVS